MSDQASGIEPALVAKPSASPTADDAAMAPEAKTFPEAHVKELRTENAGYRKRLKELESKLGEFEAAKLSESERLQKRLGEVEGLLAQREREARNMAASFEVGKVARSLKLDPDLAAALLGPDKVQFDDDGTPVGVADALLALATKFPQLKTMAPTTGASPTVGQSGTPTETDEQRRNRLFGAGRSIFDSAHARQMGGGVFTPPGSKLG